MAPTTKYSTFLVFESSLLLLFGACIFCGHSKTSLTKSVLVSFLRVTQTCKKCLKTRVWDSQPYIGKTLAGNLLVSAAILFVGALPAQALRMFNMLNCCTIGRKTYFRHQRFFLQPTIHSIWTSQQQGLISSFRRERKALVLAGNGISDSPGHCAKYGSYLVLELSCNKLMDFKLVQVKFNKSVLIAVTVKFYKL